ncbi:hypothetical protein BJF78_07850 [Pseudonocardia sp. CNS-139]|nr:hypothetical protein BJF78_07850 [Pseudonocardia sp. CNS-139]
MSDLEVSHSGSMSRQEAAKVVRALADALAEDGSHVRLRLGNSTAELRVPEQVRVELELEVDGAEVELECELTWQLGGRPRAGTSGHRKPAADAEG